MTQPYVYDAASYLTADAARAEVARQATELHLLHQVRTTISDSDRPADVVRQVVEALASHIGFAHVGAYSVRDAELRLVHQVGYDAPAEILSINSGICGFVASTDEPVFVADTRADSRYLAVLEDVTSEICVPYGSTAGHRGVLNVEGTQDRPLTIDDLRVILEIAVMLTSAIERAEMRSRQRVTEQRLELALSAGEVGVWTWNPKAASIEWLIGPDHPLAKLLPEQTSVQGSARFAGRRGCRALSTFVRVGRNHGVARPRIPVGRSARDCRLGFDSWPNRSAGYCRRSCRNRRRDNGHYRSEATRGRTAAPGTSRDRANQRRRIAASDGDDHRPLVRWICVVRSERIGPADQCCRCAIIECRSANKCRQGHGLRVFRSWNGAKSFSIVRCVQGQHVIRI